MRDPLRLMFVRFTDETYNGYSRISLKLPQAIDETESEEYPIEIAGDPRGDYDYIVYCSSPAVYQIGKRDGELMDRRMDVIPHTMYDATPAPDTFVNVINRSAFCWVPTKWVKRTFWKSGVEVPIAVAGYGVDTEEFPLTEKGNTFTVLSSGLQMFPKFGRKNLHLVARAWHLTGLHEEEDAKLILKATFGIKKASFPQIPNVEYVIGRLSGEEWRGMVGSCHVYVSASSGEGFGLVPLEAMSAGAAVVATDWGGHTDWLKSSPAYPLRVAKEVPATQYNNIYGGDAIWAQPDVEHLASLLRHCYENQDEVHERGLAGATHIRENWTWECAGRRACKALWEAHERAWS